MSYREEIYLAPLEPSVSPTVLEADGSTSRWEKELLRVGSWVHPNNPKDKLRVTPEFLRRMVANFRAARRDRTPVQRDHGSDWTGTVGDVTDLTIEGDRLMATIAVSDAEATNAIASKKVTGISAGYHEDWPDKTTGQTVGPTLLHVALTNSPYVGGLAGFAALSEPDSYIYLDEADDDDTATVTVPTPTTVTVPAPTEMNLKDTAELLLHNPDLDEADVPEIQRLAALAAQRLPARYAGGNSGDDEHAETVAARTAALNVLTTDEVVLRENIERTVRTQHPNITDGELDEVARLTALAKRFQ